MYVYMISIQGIRGNVAYTSKKVAEKIAKRIRKRYNLEVKVITCYVKE